MNARFRWLVLAALGCEPIDTQVGAWQAPPNTALYLEAEGGQLSGGFVIADAAAASGRRVIVPPSDFASDIEPGAARAVYDFSLDDGDYLIWGRLRSPDALHNRFWLRMDEGGWTLWRISTGDIFYWDDVHVNANYGSPLHFALQAGSHQLQVANAVDGVQLDRLYITAQADVPPGNDTPCHPPHSISVQGECLPSCGSQSGTACSDVDCQGLPLLAAYDCGVCCHVEP